MASEDLDEKKGKLLSLAFERVILDEAHQVNISVTRVAPDTDLAGYPAF